MSKEKLAEAIILQAMDDLYEYGEREQSVNFFTGEGFAESAVMAGMGHESMMGVLEFVSFMVSVSIKPSFREICVRGGYGQLHRGRGPRVQ